VSAIEPVGADMPGIVVPGIVMPGMAAAGADGMPGWMPEPAGKPAGAAGAVGAPGVCAMAGSANAAAKAAPRIKVLRMGYLRIAP
jgi:hypothetical protein